MTSQPIGPLVDAHPAKRPERTILKGRAVTLVPLDAEAHGDDLFEGANGGEKDLLWTYLFDGPYTDRAVFKAGLAAKAQSADPLFFAILDNATGRAVGYQTFLRIEPAHRVIEIGNILYTPAMQRTVGATEAQYLFAAACVRRPRLSPLRMEVQRPQRAVPERAARLGFTFEGVFRQHMIVKGRNRDTAWFSMLDSEWPRGQARFRALAGSRQFRRGRAAEGLAGRAARGPDLRRPATPFFIILNY